MGPLVVATLVWLGYEFGKSRPEKSILFHEKEKEKQKLDANLSQFQKMEVGNALLYLNDPQQLHVMAMGLQQSPIAGNAIEEKSQAIQARRPYQAPDFDYT
jgi:hypothetical protein